MQKWHTKLCETKGEYSSIFSNEIENFLGHNQKGNDEICLKYLGHASEWKMNDNTKAHTHTHTDYTKYYC